MHSCEKGALSLNPLRQVCDFGLKAREGIVEVGYQFLNAGRLQGLIAELAPISLSVSRVKR